MLCDCSFKNLVEMLVHLIYGIIEYFIYNQSFQMQLGADTAAIFTRCLALNTRFFISNVFFKSASVLLNVFMNGTLDVASVLLNTCNHHYTETHFILSIFVSMSRPRSIYVVSIWSIFHFQHNFITINYIISIKHVLVLCTFFRMSPMICGWWMKKVSNFQIAKVQSQGVA